MNCSTAHFRSIHTVCVFDLEKLHLERTESPLPVTYLLRAWWHIKSLFFFFLSGLWSFTPAFTGVGYQPSAQPPTWRTRGSLFVWSLPFDLFGMGVPARSLKTPADIALGVTGTHKPYHHCKVVIPSVQYKVN